MKRLIVFICLILLLTGCKRVQEVEVSNHVFDAVPTSVVNSSEKKRQTTEVRKTGKGNTKKRTTTTKKTSLEKEKTITTKAKSSKEQKLLALKRKYPEGMSWTEEKEYAWHGGIWKRGFGCAAFAFLLSDALYGEKAAKKSVDFVHIEVGDVIRIVEDTHFVVVLEVHKNEIVVAEGNYDGKVHWGRKIKRTEIGKEKDYILKRG